MELHIYLSSSNMEEYSFSGFITLDKHFLAPIPGRFLILDDDLVYI